MRRRTLSSFIVSCSIWFSSLIRRFKFCAQQFLAVMNSPLHGREWNSHKRADALERHIVQKMQSQRHRVISRKTVERFYHLLVSFLLGKRLRQGFNLFEQRLVERHTFTQMRCLALRETQRTMTCYRRQPRREPPWLFDAGQRFEREQKSVLRHIFRIVATNDTARQSHDRWPISEHKLFKRLQIAENRPDHEQFVRRLRLCHRHSTTRRSLV